MNTLKPGERKWNISSLSYFPGDHCFFLGTSGHPKPTQFWMESSHSQMKGNRLTRHMWRAVMAILQKQPYLEKTHVFSLILCLHLIVSAKTLCTVGINNCKANTPCNLTLQLCFLHESQNTVERKGNTATPIWSGWFLFHRCSYHTTGSPQTAEILPQCTSNYKESQPSDAFGPRHARELNTWLEAFYFKVCISRGHVKIREDLSHRHKNANTCMFFGLYCT